MTRRMNGMYIVAVTKKGTPMIVHRANWVENAGLTRRSSHRTIAAANKAADKIAKADVRPRCVDCGEPFDQSTRNVLRCTPCIFKRL